MKNFLGKLFSREKINTGRQKEADLLRGFALIIICICHTCLFLTSDTTSGIYYFADIIGSEPGAPVFMALMGLSIVFSRKQTSLDFLKRGINLLIIAYVLNLLRSFPYWIVGELDYFASIPGFFVVDILQFAGLSFLLFALFKKIKMPYWSMFVVSILFLITGQILMAFPSVLEFPREATYVLNLFLPLNNDWCCFNLMTWFIYPCFGLIIGELLIRCKNKKNFYLILLILGSIGVIVLYLNIGLRFPNYTEYYYGGNFYRMGILNSLITLLFFCFLLALFYFIDKILPLFCKTYLSFLSKNVNAFYLLSWVYLSPIIHLQAFYKTEFNVITIIGLMFGMAIFCSLLSLVYSKIKIYNKKRKAISN